jgi:hypothetical protein
MNFAVLQILDEKNRSLGVCRLADTRYGQLLFIFVPPSDELESFKLFVEQSLKPGQRTETLLVAAENLEGVRDNLTVRHLLPSGPSRIAVEGSIFFDECFAELICGTIWE